MGGWWLVVCGWRLVVVVCGWRLVVGRLWSFASFSVSFSFSFWLLSSFASLLSSLGRASVIVMRSLAVVLVLVLVLLVLLVLVLLVLLLLVLVLVGGGGRGRGGRGGGGVCGVVCGGNAGVRTCVMELCFYVLIGLLCCYVGIGTC